MIYSLFWNSSSSMLHKAFYLKMKDDYFFYLAEVAALDEKGIGSQLQPGQRTKKCDQQRGIATNTSYQTGSGPKILCSIMWFWNPQQKLLSCKNSKPLLLYLIHEVENWTKITHKWCSYWETTRHCGHWMHEEAKPTSKKEEKSNWPSSLCLPHTKIHMAHHLSSMLSHKEVFFFLWFMVGLLFLF